MEVPNNKKWIYSHIENPVLLGREYLNWLFKLFNVEANLGNATNSMKQFTLAISYLEELQKVQK